LPPGDFLGQVPVLLQAGRGLAGNLRGQALQVSGLPQGQSPKNRKAENLISLPVAFLLTFYRII